MKTTHKLGLLNLLFIFLVYTPPLKSQDISRSVIGSNGSFYNNLIFGDLHFTLGEVAVSRLTTDEIELGEGFHRSYYELIVDTKEVFPLDWEVNVFPNPTSDRIQIKLSDISQANAQLFNNLGQLMIETNFQSSTEEIDLNNLPAGTYWLHLKDDESRQGIFQIQKISL